MKSILFDTSIYGELVDDDLALTKIVKCVNTLFLVFGSSTVKGELEETPAVTLVSRGKFKGLNLRELLLWLYKLFVEESGGEIKVNDLVEVLALRYQMEYKNSVSAQTLNDFRIVAAASLQAMSLFISADKKQVSKQCKAVYLAVNTHYQLATPLLIEYREFKASLENYAEEDEEAGK